MARAAKQNTQTLLMPKATAVWLVENTMLTFKQIAEFTEMTEIEVEALANEEIGRGIVGRDPIEHGELTQETLDASQKDFNTPLVMAKRDLPAAKSRSKGPRYTPVSKRGDKPDAIAFIIKHHPDITDAQISKLIGTTKPTIGKIRDRSYAGMQSVKPRHPADLGLCTYVEFETVLDKALRAAGKDPEAIKAQKEAELAKQQESEEETSSGSQSSGGFDFSNFLPDSGN